MTPFQQITAQRREQRRYEKRLREQSMAVYRYQVKLAQEQTYAAMQSSEIAFPSHLSH